MTSVRARPGGARPVSVLGRGLVGALVALWLLLPLVPMLVWVGAERWSFPAVLPQEWGWSGWRTARGAGLVGALGTSTALAGAVTLLATPIGLLAGRAWGWRLVRRPGPAALLLLLPVALPAVTVAMGLDVVILRLGIPDRLAVLLILVAMAVPYAVYTFAVGFDRIPSELEEQARALGAGPVHAWVSVVLPALRRSVVVAALLAFLVGWSDYVVTVLVGGGRMVTAPVLLGSTAAGVGNEPTVAAIAAATVTPPVVLVLGVLGWHARAGRGSPDHASGGEVGRR